MNFNIIYSIISINNMGNFSSKKNSSYKKEFVFSHLQIIYLSFHSIHQSYPSIYDFHP